LVCNAEATLTQAEKSFFNRVSSKLSKPNIFILNNRWDASAAEPEEMEQVREQHMTQFRRFLVQDLQVCTGEEAKDRIFFVSAREVLNSRAKKIQQSPSTMLAEGHLLRAQDFHNFEQQFETCISKSAIRTKFEGHIRRGREIMLSLQKIVESVHADALREKETRSLLHRSKLSELRQSQSSFLQFETKSRENADRLRAEVHVKVSADFHDEIRRLQSIIDSFDEKFVDDPACIAEYKNRLTDYVDDQVTKELEIRCTGGLLERIMAAQRDMLGGVAGLLPEDYAAKVATVLQYRPGFRFCIAVNCHTLVDDFVEDLEFRFSFGLTALVRRYVAYRSGRPVTTLSGQSARNLMLGSSSSMIPNRTTPTASPSRQSSVVKPSSSTSDMQSLLAATAADDAMLNSIVLTTASYVANGGVGLLLVTGLVYRTVGWRVIAIGAAGYMGLYAFERLRWNTHAKEQHLKEQFRSHLACRMRQLASAHTNQCETQVVREMEEILKSLKATVAGVHNNMKTDVSKLQSDMEQLDRITKELVVTKNKATFLSTNLDSFETDFLKPDSP
uniref:Dynamin-type G domain-containing protein n=1 Tax=Plectus sambesii TaxID=2011161 RepID=A0A914UXM9_9BILA